MTMTKKTKKMKEVMMMTTTTPTLKSHEYLMKKKTVDGEKLMGMRERKKEIYI